MKKLIAATAMALAIPGVVQAAPTHHATLNVVAWNERSFPRMSGTAYDDDILSDFRSGWVKAPATAYLQSEFQKGTGEIQRAESYANGEAGGVPHNLAVRGARADTMETFQRGPRFRIGATQVRTIHRAVGAHSPARHYVATWTHYHGFRVVFAALHLTNGCWPSNPHRVARCAALRDEEATMRRWVAYEHAHHWTVVIGGDLNTMHRVVWGPRQVSTKPVTSMQTAVIPAAGVVAHIDHVRIVHSLHTDHPLTDTTITLEN